MSNATLQKWLSIWMVCVCVGSREGKLVVEEIMQDLAEGSSPGPGGCFIKDVKKSEDQSPKPDLK